MRGTLVFNGVNAEIGLPSIETIARIEIGNRANDSVVTVENPDDVNVILFALSEARVPIITSSFFWTRAAHDRPTTGVDYLSINIFGEHLYFRAFLYIEANNGYVYMPYQGVYRIDSNTVRVLLQDYLESET
jgi:hypothetical protein